MFKTVCAIFVILSLFHVTSCAGQYYCSGSNFSPLYLKFGGHTRAINVRGCYTASYVKSTCDISFHDSEATIASIPFRTRRKRQTYFGGSGADIFSSLLSRPPAYNSGLTVPFNVNQYVNSLPRNSILYAIMTDARAAAYYKGIPYCEKNLIGPLWQQQAFLRGRQDIWYYQRPDGTRKIIAFNAECPYSCLTQ
ncbi:hypothetical protein ACKWTF_009529 [Chironomus riparius]